METKSVYNHPSFIKRFSPRNSAAILQHNADVYNSGLMEVLMMLEIAHNSITLEYVKTLCRQLTAETPEQQEAVGVHHYYGKGGVKHICQLILKDIDEYDKVIQQMLQSVKTFEDNEYKDLTPHDRYMKFTCNMANALDDGDSILGNIIGQMKDYFIRHTPKYGDIKPMDPDVLQNLMLCFTLATIGRSFYDQICIGIPKYKNHGTQFLQMLTMTNRVIQLWCKVRFPNQYGQPLRYNRFKVMENPEFCGTKDPVDGFWKDGLMCRYRDALISTKLADRLMYLRDGVDYGWRNVRSSLFVHGVNTIDVPKDISDLQQ